MNFELTDERRMLQDSLRRVLADRVTPDRMAKASQTALGYDAPLWEELSALGVISALLPEQAGGFGGGGFDLAVVFEEVGRAGAVLPLIESGVLAGGLLAQAGRMDAVQQIMDGAIVGFAHAEPDARYSLEHVSTRAQPSPQGWRLTGRKALVGFAPAAQAFVVSARSAGAVNAPEGLSLFWVPQGAKGLTLHDYPLVGGGRAAEITLDGVSATANALIGPEGQAFELLEQAQARAICALCAEALGLMEAIRALTVDYLRTRHQFGQPIGRFQALQHRMADLVIEIEQARSAVINLAGHLDQARALRERHVSATKNLIGRVAKLVVEEAIQMHGGIGMTQDYALGHFAKRLTLVDHRFGDADHHLQRFVQLGAG